MCLQVIIKQCKIRKATLRDSVPFDINNGEVLYISSIDSSGVNNHEWELNIVGKLNVSEWLHYLYLFLSNFSRLFTFVILNIGKYFQV